MNGTGKMEGDGKMSKEDILGSIEKNKPEPKPLINDFVFDSNLKKAEPVTLLEENLSLAGAEVIGVATDSEAAAWINERSGELVDFRDREQWQKYPADVAKQDLEQINTAIVEGHFGVAENGAIWLIDSDFPHRLVPFIPQELIILLDRGQIVRNMHEAYRKIKLEDLGFGIFISGPSKTADIEQSLVFGAHGPGKLTVLLINQYSN